MTKKKIKFREKECRNCSRRLEKALKKLDKVQDVEVDCDNYVVTLTLIEPVEDVILEDIFLDEDYEILFIE